MGCTTVLIDGAWHEVEMVHGTFQSFNPQTGEAIPGAFPIVGWHELERMVSAAQVAARELADIEPERIARFLESYADRIEASAQQLTETAGQETALPVPTRLAGIELPRTTSQLRQAAAGARDISADGWSMPRIDPETNIRSRFESLGGAVLVIGPNNFPLAFNAISGGDFASAIAAGNPVIAKGHPAHPETTRLLAELARQAVEEVGLPKATVQCFFHAQPDDIAQLIAHPGLASVAFTGGKTAGLAIKEAADAAGKISYLEMSSLNPVVLMPDVIEQDFTAFVDQWAGSIQMGSGQFCTKPGLCFVVGEEVGEALSEEVARRFDHADNAVLLTEQLVQDLDRGIRIQQDSGAILVVGGVCPEEPGFRYPPSLLISNGSTFLEMPESMQRELFGPAAMIVVCSDEDELCSALRSLSGQLTACVWTTGAQEHEALYQRVVSILRPACGRLLENKMPTGVAVVESMVHGGPFPATSHPGFTAVGMPTSIRRFAAHRCYDGIPSTHLPAALT